MPATTWGLGHYPLMAARLEDAACKTVELAGIGPGDRVLDVACGTGNAALIAAERGAQAVGVDFEPALLDIARERAPHVDFREGDVAALPAEDGEFTAVVSVFGVMYAPDHEAAAREVARVAKPVARVALASWTPGSFMPAMGQALGPYLPPPPPGSGPPSRWGDEEALTSILESAGLALTAATRERLDTEDMDVDFLINTAGHVLAERERLEREGRWQALRDDLQGFVEQGLPLEYLLASARAAS
jgi:SAM-dependent methyltransferase